MNKDQYINIIELQKQALQFYADENNYVKKLPDLSINKLVSHIDLDKGTQARFVLNQIKSLNDFNENIESEYVDYVKSLEEESVNINGEDLLQALNKLKKDINNFKK